MLKGRAVAHVQDSPLLGQLGQFHYKLKNVAQSF